MAKVTNIANETENVIETEATVVPVGEKVTTEEKKETLGSKMKGGAKKVGKFLKDKAPIILAAGALGLAAVANVRINGTDESDDIDDEENIDVEETIDI